MKPEPKRNSPLPLAPFGLLGCWVLRVRGKQFPLPAFYASQKEADVARHTHSHYLPCGLEILELKQHNAPDERPANTPSA